MLNVTNKKYQKLKVFISDTSSIVIGPKQSELVNVKEPSQHMKDLEKDGLIQIKKVNK